MHKFIDLNCPNCYTVEYGYRPCELGETKLDFGYPKSMFVDSVNKFQKMQGITYISDRDYDLMVSNYYQDPLVPLNKKHHLFGAPCFGCNPNTCFDQCYQYRFRRLCVDKKALEELSKLKIRRQSPWILKVESENDENVLLSVRGSKAFAFLTENKDLFDKYMFIDKPLVLIKPKFKKQKK